MNQDSCKYILKLHDKCPYIEWITITSFYVAPMTIWGFKYQVKKNM